ncbi:MAG: tetratricopeptide repeat protein [Firmicutes bacterium]|nr:tetratricopeptide repeat protein [Bacillota bacterium]
MKPLRLSLFAMWVGLWGLPVSLPARAAVLVQEPTATQERTPEERIELRGDVLMARKQYSEAIDAYEELLQRLGYREPGFWRRVFTSSPRDRRAAAVLNKIGICYQQLNDFRNARKYYKRAMRQDDTFYNPVNNLGTVYYHEEDYDDAIRYYKKAISLDPTVATVYSNLGHAYFARKKYEESLAAFVQALRLDPQVFERHGRGGSLVQHGLPGERALFFFFLAKSYARMGDVERCAYYLRKAQDEGYAHLQADVTKDPDFAPLLHEPLIQQVLHPERIAATPLPPPDS